MNNYKKVVVPENEKTRHLWDINETEGFRSYGIDGQTYTVNVKRSHNNLKECAKVLRFIDLYIKQLIDDLVKRCMERGVMSESCKIISNTPYVVQEIEYDSGFHGINKPKGIIHSGTTKKHFKLDNDLRATWRLIMLELRESDGSFMPWSSIKTTLLHELAHTMCNHIRYRTSGNHQKDFHDCESVTKELGYNPSPKLKECEDQIKYSMWK